MLDGGDEEPMPRVLFYVTSTFDTEILGFAYSQHAKQCSASVLSFSILVLRASDGIWFHGVGGYISAVSPTLLCKGFTPP